MDILSDSYEQKSKIKLVKIDISERSGLEEKNKINLLFVKEVEVHYRDFVYKGISVESEYDRESVVLKVDFGLMVHDEKLEQIPDITIETCSELQIIEGHTYDQMKFNYVNGCVIVYFFNGFLNPSD